MSYFDLNIRGYLKDWDIFHAVRELISNAMDESVISGTDKPIIKKIGDKSWQIIDFGRGINPSSLVISENTEKVKPGVIGKFGIGLKDAINVFQNNNIKLTLQSKFGLIEFELMKKHGFEDLTIHAKITPCEMMIGTVATLANISDDDINKARELFLIYSPRKRIYCGKFGEIYERLNSDKFAGIYINGLQISHEDDFLFHYNITNITATIRKGLNRERNEVGSTVYAERIQHILKEGINNSDIIKNVVRQIFLLDKTKTNELRYKDIKNEASILCKEVAVVVTKEELVKGGKEIEELKSSDKSIVIVSKDEQKSLDAVKLPAFAAKSDAKKLEYTELTDIEFAALPDNKKRIWELRSLICNQFDINPKIIRLSNDLNCDGLCVRKLFGSKIILHVNTLETEERFFGNLIHEITHYKYKHDDVSKDFESDLSNQLGYLAAKSLGLK